MEAMFKKDDTIKFIIPGKPEYIKVVRMSLAALASGAGFDVEAAEDIKLAVEEACKAITCHGFKAWTNKYEVECRIEDDRMTIYLTDIGDGRDIEKQYRPCEKCPQDGDMALILIKTLMDSVEIATREGNKKSIVMVKNK